MTHLPPCAIPVNTLSLPCQSLAPPSFVPASYVLVQVFAVGLDPLDSLLVQEKTVNGAKGAGFIPGRSIVGKAVEVGWDVKRRYRPSTDIFAPTAP